MNRILAIIVTYNRKELLTECIEALLKQKYADFDILLVDNASTDGTDRICRKYEEQYENILYHNTGANIGGAGGFHYGMKYGVQQGYDYFWLMDDDTVAYEDTLQELLKADEELNGNYGFLSSAAVWFDGELCKMNMPGLMGYSSYKEFSHVKAKRMKVDWASFVSLFVKRETVEEVGLPIKEFFIWCDDVEFTKRVAERYESYFVFDSKVLHKMGQNVGADVSTDDAKRAPRYFYEYRNCVYIAKHSGIVWILNQVYRFFYFLIRITVNKVDHKAVRYWAVLKGFLSGIWFCPKIEYVRYEEKK